MNFVLDASVALAWCFGDEGGDYAMGVLEVLRTSEAVAASHWGLEVANAFLVAERRGRIDSGDVPRLARFLLALPIAVDPVARRRAVESIHRMGRAHRLSAYDAAYLELAVRHGIPIATLDSELRVAAEAEGVGILAIEG
ncbi:MAG: type II toxin-antitoxin system VapC family toxin [Longimicrobiales bacterium]